MDEKWILPEQIPESVKGKNLAEKHVDWFLGTIRPLLIDRFIHGYKHGLEADKPKPS